MWDISRQKVRVKFYLFPPWQCWPECLFDFLGPADIMFWKHLQMADIMLQILLAHLHLHAPLLDRKRLIGFMRNPPILIWDLMSDMRCRLIHARLAIEVILWLTLPVAVSISKRVIGVLASFLHHKFPFSFLSWDESMKVWYIDISNLAVPSCAAAFIAFNQIKFNSCKFCFKMHCFELLSVSLIVFYY